MKTPFTLKIVILKISTIKWLCLVTMLNNSITLILTLNNNIVNILIQFRHLVITRCLNLDKIQITCSRIQSLNTRAPMKKIDLIKFSFNDLIYGRTRI